MGLGSLLHWTIARTGFVLPPFVSALLMGVLDRVTGALKHHK